MKIYTKTGDKGQTSLVGTRVDKDHMRVDAYGTLDEANSFVGLAVTFLPDGEEFQSIREHLQKIQFEIFDCGGELAIVDGKTASHLKAKEITIEIEQLIDAYSAELPPLRRFILPGGTKAAGFLHAARTKVREAERKVVTLKKSESVNDDLLIYLNRLSDYLFVASRYVNMKSNVSDVEYFRK